MTEPQREQQHQQQCRLSQKSFTQGRVVNNKIDAIYGEQLYLQPVLMVDPSTLTPPPTEVHFEILIRKPSSTYATSNAATTLSSGVLQIHQSDIKNIFSIGSPIKIDIRTMEEHFLDSKMHFINNITIIETLIPTPTMTIMETIAIHPQAIMSLRTKVQTIIINNLIVDDTNDDPPFIERVMECQIENLLEQPFRITSFSIGLAEATGFESCFIGEGDVVEFPIRIPCSNSRDTILSAIDCYANDDGDDDDDHNDGNDDDVFTPTAILGRAKIRWTTESGRSGILETNDITAPLPTLPQKTFGPFCILRQPSQSVRVGQLSTMEVELFNNLVDPSNFFIEIIKKNSTDDAMIAIIDYEIRKNILLLRLVPRRLGNLPLLFENLFINVSE